MHASHVLVALFLATASASFVPRPFTDVARGNTLTLASQFDDIVVPPPARSAAFQPAPVTFTAPAHTVVHEDELDGLFGPTARSLAQQGPGTLRPLPPFPLSSTPPSFAPRLSGNGAVPRTSFEMHRDQATVVAPHTLAHSFGAPTALSQGPITPPQTRRSSGHATPPQTRAFSPLPPLSSVPSGPGSLPFPQATSSQQPTIQTARRSHAPSTRMSSINFSEQHLSRGASEALARLQERNRDLNTRIQSFGGNPYQPNHRNPMSFSSVAESDLFMEHQGQVSGGQPPLIPLSAASQHRGSDHRSSSPRSASSSLLTSQEGTSQQGSQGSRWRWGVIDHPNFKTASDMMAIARSFSANAARLAVNTGENHARILDAMHDQYNDVVRMRASLARRGTEDMHAEQRVLFKARLLEVDTVLASMRAVVEHPLPDYEHVLHGFNTAVQKAQEATVNFGTTAVTTVQGAVQEVGQRTRTAFQPVADWWTYVKDMWIPHRIPNGPGSRSMSSAEMEQFHSAVQHAQEFVRQSQVIREQAH